MISRFLELDRKSFLVQFVAVEPIVFYSTADGTDLVQDILRKHLARDDSEIVGQEGAMSIDDNGEFLTFEPTDTKNRTLHLPVEHLAYSGALRRMKEDKNDTRNPDQIKKRSFENVDLANRYPQDIIGPPVFVGVFHGFDNALCYTFITQSADDACLLVMKLMRVFRQHEQQQIEQQGQINQGPSSHLPFNNHNNTTTTGSPLSVSYAFENPPYQSLPLNFIQTPNMYQQDDFIQSILSNPNMQIVDRPAPIYSQQFDNNIQYLSSDVNSKFFSY
mgnify:FL=1